LKYPESAMVRGIFLWPEKARGACRCPAVMVMGAFPGAHPFGAPLRASSPASCLRLKRLSSGRGWASARPSDLAGGSACGHCGCALF